MEYVKFRVLHSVCNMHLLVLLGRRESVNPRDWKGTGKDNLEVRVPMSLPYVPYSQSLIIFLVEHEYEYE